MTSPSSQMRMTVIWGASLVALCALAIFVALSMLGGDEAGSRDLTPIEQCFANQESIEKAAANRNAQTGDQSADVKDLLPVYLDRVPSCPESGQYAISWTAQMPQCTCSVHPWHGDEQ